MRTVSSIFKSAIYFIIFFFNFSHAQQTVKAFTFQLSEKFNNVRDFTISSSGNEAYLSIQSPSPLSAVSVLVKIEKKNNIWEKPQLLPFSGQFNDLEPFLSVDNLRLYFASNRPLDENNNAPKDYDIWYVERVSVDSEWGKPINLGTSVNTEHNEFYPSLAKNRNLYFTSDRPSPSKGQDDIFYARWNQNKYESPISLSKAINTQGFEFNAFIDPDESYIIFSGYNREDGLGSGDLYISYKNSDGSWSQAENLGSEVNSDQMDYCPYISYDGATLYFTSRRSEFNKSYNFQSIDDVIKEVNKSKNGLSKIYSVSTKLFLKK